MLLGLSLQFWTISLLILSFLILILYIGRRNKKGGLMGFTKEVATSQGKFFISHYGIKNHEKAGFVLMVSAGILALDWYLGFPSGFNAIRGFLLIMAGGCAVILLRQYLKVKK